MPTSIPAWSNVRLRQAPSARCGLDIPRPEYPKATGSITCDLLVIGGGYTGLWAALHAAQRNPDRRIVLIDANRIGWAASGRNGGFVDASLTHGMENGKARWPNEMTPSRRWACRTSMACRQTSSRSDSTSNGSAQACCRWPRNHIKSTGSPTRPARPRDCSWALSEVRDEVHSPTYLAGLYNPDTTAIGIRPSWRSNWPAPAETPVCQIYEHTNAQRIESVIAALRVECGAASITCRNIVLATNVFPSLLKRNRLHTIPVYDYVLATQPLTDAQLERIGWRHRQGIGDSANQFHLLPRLTMDNRIVWGGYDAVLPLRPQGRRPLRGPGGHLPAAGRTLLHHLPRPRRCPVHPPLGGRHRHQHPVLCALGTGT